MNQLGRLKSLWPTVAWLQSVWFPAAALIVADAMTPGAAKAGAWTLAEGDGIAITTVARKVTPISGLLGGTADSDQTEVQVFLEYGVLDDLTFGFTALNKFSMTQDIVEMRFGAHLRKRVWQGKDGDVASIQAGFALPAEGLLGGTLGDNRPNSVSEIDVRALYGRGWGLSWTNAFVSTEAGLRWRGESQPDELRFDTIAGIEPWRGFQGLVGLFVAVPVGGGTVDQDTSLKFAPSVAYTAWPWLGDNDKKPDGLRTPVTFQLGMDIDVLSPSDGISFSFSLWNRF